RSHMLLFFRSFLIVASAPSIKLGHPHPVSAYSPATPSPHTIFAGVIEKSCALWIVATFQTGKISAAEQLSGGLSERNEKLSRLIQFRFESAFELPRSLN